MSIKSVLFPVVLGIGAIVTTVGIGALINFDTAPGHAANAPLVWPKDSKLHKLPNRKQIVVIAHPRCSCTPATFEELAQIPDIAVSVLFFRPGPESDWREDTAGGQLSKIGGATALWDDGGQQARLFGGSTSGSVLLYSEEGRLLFQGGITPSRGHTGENLGLEQLRKAIRTGSAAGAAPPVFGCSLLGGVLS